MLHALGPTQVADVDQAVDTVFDFDECAEIRKVAYPAFHLRTDREFFVQAVPWVRGELPHTERNAPFRGVHVEHDALDLVADIDQLRRMLHALRPSHLADVHEPFNTLLQLDERTVIGNANDAPSHVRAHRIAMFSVQPR